MSTTTAVTIQQATVDALEALSDPARGIYVEAWAVTEWSDEQQARVPVPATEACSNDTAHGKGYCYGPTGDALCLACQIVWIEQDQVDRSSYSIDVAA